MFSNSNDEVDYAGIGVNVLSLKPGGGVFRLSGTSMACPHVAGLVACVLTTDLSGGGDDGDDGGDGDDGDDEDGGGQGGFDCCGLFSSPAQSGPGNDVTTSIFEGINDDASLRKFLNQKMAIDIGLTGPDNSTGLGFLSYLSKDEVMEMI